jgi:hypothetical protein
MTAWVCRDVAGVSVAQVAKYFHRDTATLSKGLARLEEAAKGNPAIKRRLDRLSDELRSR